MWIVRPIKESDTEAFCELVYGMTLGMRSLPKNKERLAQKITQSIHSFTKDGSLPEQELYLFVLEDTTTGQIFGTCAIWTAKGIYWQDQYYRIETIPSSCPWRGASKEIKALKVVSPREDLTEIGSLYLQPTLQHHGLGSLLSLSRFLFAAGHLHRFFSKVIAELRGVIYPNQTCPFWEGVGRHFCDIPFSELMARLDEDKSVIPLLLPSHPIYVALLPKEVQEVIEAINESTAGALKILSREGFAVTKEI